MNTRAGSAMSLLVRGTDSVRTRGVIPTLRRLYLMSADYWFDIRYSLQTEALIPIQLNNLTVKSINRERGGAYYATRILPLRRLLKRIQPLIPADGVLVDLGCGKGRVLMVASELGFREVRGVEFAEELCQLARSNCAAYKRATGTQTEFQIIEADAVDYAIRPDENVFFLFNSFDSVVLRKVLGNLVRSLDEVPRRTLIISHGVLYPVRGERSGRSSALRHPNVNDVVQTETRFVRVLADDFWGHRYDVYANAM
jgi:SAM-dependent methyltransferase